MSGALIMSGLSLAITVFDIASFLQSLGGAPDPLKQTQVTIVVGNAPNSGGSEPDIYVKGPSGMQLAYSTDKSLFNDGHLKGAQAKTFIIDNDEDDDGETLVQQPQYVSVVMTGGDAICVSAILANGNGAQYVWTGDMGQKCGAEWYESDFAFGTSNVPPKCVWLDQDHTNGIVASAVGIHMTDFTPQLLGQYQEKNKAGDDLGDPRLCRNSARMTFFRDFEYANWKNFVDGNGSPQPLKYNETGQLVNPEQGIDREKRAYPDGTVLPWEEKPKAKRDHPRKFGRERFNMNQYPDHLTVSHKDSHSARRLCESSTSRGADFVAVNAEEKLFCDMSEKKLYDVCDEKNTKACFDVEKQEMRDVGAKLRKRDDAAFGEVVPKKKYTSTSTWK